ncbi:MAG: cysteine--tRNA ligase [Erysipelotrichaceae bacterium]|nr:cysteine--tRNA ligase [Erysipelotrichaceae bacterium]
MKIFNSMHNKIEVFQPIQDGHVSIYVCGPTVYNYPHIGNVRPIIVFDTLRRTFEAIGYQVKMVSNYTDVDDKIIKAAKEMGVSEQEVSEKFIQAYNQDRCALHAKMPDAAPRVTQTMDAIIDFIKLLVEKGYAYEKDGDVYFRVNEVDEYGHLSNQQVQDLMVGARIDENSKKENALDFTLWKKTEEGIKWESPWSVGRPGWHTECVVMIQQEFGEGRIDIHGGGMDLKFPHHENEIAQSRAVHHHPIANYWMHNGMVNIEGEKMSKSLGNVIWAKDMIEKISGNVLRWVMLGTHYRSPLNINEETIEMAKTELEKLKNSMKQAYVKIALANTSIEEAYDEELYRPFIEAMEDDLNTPNAFAALFDTVKSLNTTLRQREVDITRVKEIVKTLEMILCVLGIKIDRIVLEEEDKQLYMKWQEAKKEKDFETADKLRNTLMERGLL